MHGHMNIKFDTNIILLNVSTR